MDIRELTNTLPEIKTALEHYLSTKDHQELVKAYTLLTEARLTVGEQIRKDKQR